LPLLSHTRVFLSRLKRLLQLSVRGIGSSPKVADSSQKLMKPYQNLHLSLNVV